MKATGDNFLLTFTKEGIAYPVMLNEEQREVFIFSINMMPGPINIINEPIGKVITVGEFKKMKEGNK